MLTFKKTPFRIACVCFFLLGLTRVSADPIDYINTSFGSGGGGTEYGGDMPFVEPPFAMTSWTPQTRQDRTGDTSYAREDTTISGFIGTHQPAIWMGGYGYVTLMPEIDFIKTSPDNRKLPFQHRNETATPYYYSVSLDGGAGRTIMTEITATDHCGFFRFTFPDNDSSSILVEATRPNVNGFIEVDSSDQEIDGNNPDRMDSEPVSDITPNFKGYFVVQFDKPFYKSGTSMNSVLSPGNMSATGTNVGAYATFGTSDGDTVEARVGTSFISLDQARANLASELPDWDFESHEALLKSIWEKKLDQVTITGASKEQLAAFYTGMYHSLLFPRDMTEDGKHDDKFNQALAQNSPADNTDQLDAWRIFTGLGFYSSNQSSGQFMIGSPAFCHVALKLSNGKMFTIDAQNNSDTNIYIQSATINGIPLDVPYITWKQIQLGGTLKFVMGPSQSSWASGWVPRPLPTYPKVTAPMHTGQ